MILDFKHLSAETDLDDDVYQTSFHNNALYTPVQK